MKRKHLLPALAFLATSAALAQYRYTAPDGTVTFSDQPPVQGDAHVRVSELPDSAPLVAQAQLPYALSQARASFPVTLYTNSPCAPCDSARSYLKQRGIPFAEKTVTTNDDVDALKKASGISGVPVVIVGSHKLNGFNQDGWGGLLDDAGYPKTSLLPAGYVYPAAVPASGKSAPAAPVTAPPATPEVAPAASIPAAAEPPPPTGNAPPGFKF